MKIEAMDENTIAELIRRHDEPAHEYSCAEVRSLILAWATAKAEAERLAYGSPRWSGERRWTDADWIAAVLTRIGSPDDRFSNERNDREST